MGKGGQRHAQPLVFAGNVLLLLLLLSSLIQLWPMMKSEFRGFGMSPLELGADDWRNKLGQTQIVPLSTASVYRFIPLMMKKTSISDFT